MLPQRPPAPTHNSLVSSYRKSGLISAALATMFLAACGGSGGTSSPATISILAPATAPASAPGAAPAPAPAPATAVIFSSVVTDSNGAVVQDAKVTVATNSAPVTATTLADGSYALSVDVSALPTTIDTQVVLIVSKEGYETQVVEYSTSQLKAGATLALPPSQPPLVRVLSNELTPQGGAELIHLGDGGGPSSRNVNLQAPLFGLKKQIMLGTLDDIAKLAGSSDGSVSSTYPTMSLSIMFRGLDSNLCDDKISLYQSPSNDGTLLRSDLQSLISSAVPPSDATGLFSPFKHAFSTSMMNTNKGALWVEIESGACGSADLADDFEFVDVHAVFNTAP